MYNFLNVKIDEISGKSNLECNVYSHNLSSGYRGGFQAESVSTKKGFGHGKSRPVPHADSTVSRVLKFKET